MIAVDAELAQQHVEAFALGNEYRRAQDVIDVKIGRLAAFLLTEIPQQVLGQQDADHLVFVAMDHREARVSALDHHRQIGLRRAIALDHLHLRTRNHDVSHLHLRDLQHAFYHVERIAIEQAAFLRIAQATDELLARGGLA